MLFIVSSQWSFFGLTYRAYHPICSYGTVSGALPPSAIKSKKWTLSSASDTGELVVTRVMGTSWKATFNRFAAVAVVVVSAATPALV